MHQFQGSEKDAIIFDAVDCYRQRFPGMLLTSTNNNYANRLFNVALTRARGKFIAVTNVGYMENKNLSSGLLFSKLISKYKRSDGCLKGEQLERCFIGSSLPCYQWYTSNEAEAIYLRDLSNGKKEICIDIPGKLELSYDSSKKLSETLNKMRSSGIRIQIRAESKKVLPTCLQPFSIENKYIANPITLIDKRVIWFGEPLSAANFTSEGQTLKMQFRPVIRFEGRHTANALYGFMEMNRTIDQASLARDGEAGDKTLASFISAYTQCKKCGSPMKLLKSRGKYFMGCSNYPNCKSTELITVDLIERYFVSFGKTGKHCPQDHTSLEAKLGPYGVYVQCCGLARHKFKLDEI